MLPAWEDIRGVLAELDADRVAQEQTSQQKQMAEMAGEVANSVTEIERLQSVVHTIEYLLGIVYGAHFFHMLLSENLTFLRWIEKHFYALPESAELPEHHHHHYITLITLLGALAGFLFVFVVNKIRMRHGEQPKH